MQSILACYSGLGMYIALSSPAISNSSHILLFLSSGGKRTWKEAWWNFTNSSTYSLQQETISINPFKVPMQILINSPWLHLRLIIVQAWSGKWTSELLYYFRLRVKIALFQSCFYYMGQISGPINSKFHQVPCINCSSSIVFTVRIVVVFPAIWDLGELREELSSWVDLWAGTWSKALIASRVRWDLVSVLSPLW